MRCGVVSNYFHHLLRLRTRPTEHLYEDACRFSVVAFARGRRLRRGVADRGVATQRLEVRDSTETFQRRRDSARRALTTARLGRHQQLQLSNNSSAITRLHDKNGSTTHFVVRPTASQTLPERTSKPQIRLCWPLCAFINYIYLYLLTYNLVDCNFIIRMLYLNAYWLNIGLRYKYVILTVCRSYISHCVSKCVVILSIKRLLIDWLIDRWLVETPSRDVDHYRVINASRSTVWHYNDKLSRDRLSL